VGSPSRDAVAQSLTECADKPNEDPNVRGDAFKTLIVARLSYDADERDLEKEFGRFGPIERVRCPYASVSCSFANRDSDSHHC
jgi:U1 small nuclear ribonucleoprotein